MKKTLTLLLPLVLLLACGKKGQVVSPLKRDLTQAVYASGKIYPENGYKVFTKLPGYIQKIHVHIGDSIKIGQPLLTIRSEISDLNVNAAKNLYSLAQKNADENSPLLSSMRNDVAALKAKYALDSVNYQRMLNLYKDNATSKQQLDIAKTQFDVSSQQYLKAFNAYMSTRDKLRIELENAKIQYEAQLSNQSDYTLASTVNGKVYDIVPKEGELVGSQFPLLEIGDATRYYIELSVDETDVGLLKAGQEVLYTIDAFKDQTFTGAVKEIYPRIAQGNKTSKVLATIELGTGLSVFSGMSVEANIIIARRTAVLVIPRECLFSSNKLILSSGDTVVVQKGAEDLQYIEIVSGIEETSEVIKP